MSADFWAGYISGAAGIIIGNPLDLIKVRLQAGTRIAATSPTTYTSQFEGAGSLIRGATAPILGYGALNALLFVTYNRTTALLSQGEAPPSLWTTWTAGAVGGLATWVVSTPTELIKCRAQMSQQATSSWAITKDILRSNGIRGLYSGGMVTALRDSIGYGFYFWSYELSTRLLASSEGGISQSSAGEEAAKVLLCGGLAGVVTWASVFPLDVIKTRVQTQVMATENAPLLENITPAEPASPRKLGAIEVAKNAYRQDGMKVFFRGLGICSVRAFIVNAAQWAVYEWMMRELSSPKQASS
ncbi:mitochondrial carrier-3 [Coleophoma cylindrospora]|uniref:Mitochondrial carrier-3 n=1 Tax=Coleophoma cylindrospora TaxID=1849047 RepID=A0A3D8R1Q9_9HELO|nr:mitochondrial carrier-3 [Coleophoma cylindrospora]